MNATMVSLVMAECRDAVQKAKGSGGGVPEMMRAAAPLAKAHWMVLDENVQFQGAVACVYENSSDEDQERIRSELDTLRALSAAMAGVPVDWQALAGDEDDQRPKGFGLSAIWRDEKGGDDL